MMQNKSSSHSQDSYSDLFRAATNISYFLTRPIIEVFYGFRSNRLPLLECILLADLVGILILLHVDQSFLEYLGKPSWYPGQSRFYYPYCLMMTTGGFWC